MTCRPLALFLLCASSPGFAAESLDWATIGRIRDEGCFQLIQDPIEYSNGSFFGTHHTDMDVYDRLQRDDLMQAAVVIATFAYAAANRDFPPALHRQCGEDRPSGTPPCRCR